MDFFKEEFNKMVTVPDFEMVKENIKDTTILESFYKINEIIKNNISNVFNSYSFTSLFRLYSYLVELEIYLNKFYKLVNSYEMNLIEDNHFIKNLSNEIIGIDFEQIKTNIISKSKKFEVNYEFIKDLLYDYPFAFELYYEIFKKNKYPKYLLEYNRNNFLRIGQKERSFESKRGMPLFRYWELIPSKQKSIREIEDNLKKFSKNYIFESLNESELIRNIKEAGYDIILVKIVSESPIIYQTNILLSRKYDIYKGINKKFIKDNRVIQIKTGNKPEFSVNLYSSGEHDKVIILEKVQNDYYAILNTSYTRNPFVLKNKVKYIYEFLEKNNNLLYRTEILNDIFIKENQNNFFSKFDYNQDYKIDVRELNIAQLRTNLFRGLNSFVKKKTIKNKYVTGELTQRFVELLTKEYSFLLETSFFKNISPKDKTDILLDFYTNLEDYKHNFDFRLKILLKEDTIEEKDLYNLIYNLFPEKDNFVDKIVKNYKLKEKYYKFKD